MSELQGTFNCPICDWPEPHVHTKEEVAERPETDGARAAFEKYAREFMAGPYFKGPRTGYWWAYPAHMARRTDDPVPPFIHPAHGWAARRYNTGPYCNEFVEVMWQFWRMTWLAARGRNLPLEKPEWGDSDRAKKKE